MPETKVALTMRAGVLTPSFDTHMRTTETAACSAAADKREKNNGNESAMYRQRKESHSLLRVTLPAAKAAPACASHRQTLCCTAQQHLGCGSIKACHVCVQTRGRASTLRFVHTNSWQLWLPAAQSILSDSRVYLPTTMMPA